MAEITFESGSVRTNFDGALHAATFVIESNDGANRKIEFQIGAYGVNIVVDGSTLGFVDVYYKTPRLIADCQFSDKLVLIDFLEDGIRVDLPDSFFANEFNHSSTVYKEEK